MKHVIWILENKIIELEKNNSIAVVKLSDKLGAVDEIYYKALKDSTNRIILECKEAIKILSNEREGDRKHEQSQEVCLQHCPNKTKALVKCEWLDKTCFLCTQTG